MLPIMRILLLGAGISGAMAFLAPVASAIDPLEQPAAHNGDAVSAVGFAASGVEGYRVISGGEDATLRSWTLQLIEERVQLLDHEVYDIEASIDGSTVVSGEGGWNGGTSTHTLRIWPADGFDPDSELGHIGTGAPIGYVYVVAISPFPENSFTAVSGFYGKILVYDTISLTLYATKETGNKRTKAIAFSPDGKILAATWKGGTIQLFSFPEQCDTVSCELVLLPVSMSHGGTWDLSLAFWPESNSTVTKIASGTDSGMVKVWTIEDPHGDPNVTVQSVDSGGVRSLAWSPDGSMIVAGGNGDITIYDADTLEILFQEVNAHSSRVNDVAFSPDSLKIASGGNDGALKLWPAPPVAGCSTQADCDDSNDCTTDLCVENVCRYEPVPDDSACNGESGICCSGNCDKAACLADSDCYDGDPCSLANTCLYSGTCAAACDNTACGMPGDGCCGPLCDQNSDSDCACVPTHGKEKGPRCRDNIDNDCDGLVDGNDPDC